MPAYFTRRQVLRSTCAATAAVVVGAGRRASAAPKASVSEITVISKQPQLYCGWPTVARRRNGELLLVYSGGREAHVCPLGRVELMRSHDQGRTWTWPQVLLDSAIDDRDAGVLETSRGTILVTTFTSLAYEPALKAAQGLKPDDPKRWSSDKLERWNAVNERLNAEDRQKDLGEWMLRSTDDGITWSSRYPSLANSPHGPIQLSDGRLLYAGKDLWHGQDRVGVCESTDDGQNWRWLADIPTRSGDTRQNYHELHAVETADGRIVAHIRNHNKDNAGETLQSVSADGGKTWSEPQAIGVWGLPSHLLRLKDSRLLMTYGHRRPPLGNQARLSEDHGRTWSEPLIISGDGTSWDLGYPSTVELDGGMLLTVWYENLKDSPNDVLRQAKWRIEG